MIERIIKREHMFLFSFWTPELIIRSHKTPQNVIFTNATFEKKKNSEKKAFFSLHWLSIMKKKIQLNVWQVLQNANSKKTHILYRLEHNDIISKPPNWLHSAIEMNKTHYLQKRISFKKWLVLVSLIFFSKFLAFGSQLAYQVNYGFFF